MALEQQKKIKSLEHEGTERSKQSFRASREIAVREFDSCVEKLGETHRDFLGSGKSDELKPNSKEWKNRNRLFKVSEMLKAGFTAAGESQPTAEQRLAVALFALFPKKSQTQERTRIVKQLESHNGSMMHRPTNRDRGPGMTPQQKAYQAVKAKAKSYGLA